MAEYVLLRGLLAGLGLLPLGAALWLARRLGDFAFDGVRLRRRVTLENLCLALGQERCERERLALARECYRNFAMTFVELGLCARRSLDEIDRRVTLLHPEHAAAADAGGAGVLYLTAHIGNWELFGARVRRLHPDLHVVAGDQKNLLTDAHTRRLREALGMQVIAMGSALREVVRVLRRGGRVALVADQDGGREGLFLDFFGRPASHALGPVRFAWRTGAPIVMGFCRRTGPGRFVGELHPPIRLDRSRPEQEECERVLRLYARALEQAVRADPTQWFWMHRRWKSTPVRGDEACGG